jgi:ferredoxin
VLEKEIRSFLKEKGVDVTGFAGPDRFGPDQPPSLVPGYIMKGARSIVSLVLPMDVPAIYEFLSKKSPAPHNLDQFIKYQTLLRTAMDLAGFIRAKGHRAAAVPLSADYRRSPYVFSLKPSFSHRFGAIASGTAAQGWSGNVMTREYGAAVYLGTVVTDAELESDPLLPPDYFIDGVCTKCRRCVRACPSRMFEASEREYVLLNGMLHARAKRKNIDLCNIACFGLHSLSRDRKYTNWGPYWIDTWVHGEPDWKSRTFMLGAMLKRGLSTGNSTPRFDILRRLCSIPWPREYVDVLPRPDALPENERERMAVLAGFVRKLGIRGIDRYPIPMVCGHCAIVCGPTPEETDKRYRMLMEGGFVVQGPEGDMIGVKDFDAAYALYRQNENRPPAWKKLRDTFATLSLWHRYYFGIKPLTMLRARRYAGKKDRAVAAIKRAE